MKKKTYKIYVLKDPRNNEIRYVGITRRDLKVRLRCHVSDARKKVKRHYSHWIKELLDVGFFPIIESVAVVNQFSDEIYWIKKFKDEGHNLINHTDGGEGCLGRRTPLSEEHKNKISVALRGNKNGTHMSKKARQELSKRTTDRLTGVPKSESVKQKISNSLKGHKLSPQSTEKRILTLRNNKRPKKEEIELVMSLYASNKSKREIYRITNINRPRINKIINENREYRHDIIR